MVAIKALSILAAAGVAIAAPAQVGSALEARNYGAPKNFGYNYHWNDNSDDTSDDTTTPSKTQGGKKPNVVYENKDVFVTEYVTVPFGQKPQQPTQAPQPEPTKPQAPQQPSGGESEDKQWLNVPAPSATSPPSNGPTTGGYIGIVNEYRAKMGLPDLKLDPKLQANAEDTSASSGGKLVHKLNPGSMGQVMAGGEDTLEKFLHVFVGGWLCEIPSLVPGGECATQSKGWNYQGQTGHAKILSDPKYKSIGCGCKSKMWTCDVA